MWGCKRVGFERVKVWGSGLGVETTEWILPRMIYLVLFFALLVLEP